MPEEEIVPKMEEISFVGQLNGKLEDLLAKVSQIPTLASKIENGKLLVTRIESRDIHKKPFLFFLFEISESGIEVIYSIAPDTSVKMRRLFVLRNLLSVLSIISDSFKIDEKKFYQYLDSAIDDVLNSLSQNYSSLFNSYDALLTEYRELKRLNLELGAANRNLTIQTSQLSEENKKLKEELEALQTYSDESLMAMVEDWIESHNNSIDVDEFAKTYKITSPRVEQILNKMVSLGYIELKG
ncbi:MAG: hypothetical protein ACP5RK_00355 [Candidatus Micrarchaeia archaeon]